MTCLTLLGLSWKYSTTSTTNHMHLIFFSMRFLTTMLRLDQLKFEGKPNPCITAETRELMKSRNYWCKIARRTDNPADWSTDKNLKHQVQRRANLSRIRFKTIHEIQIVFGRQFAFVSLKDLSHQNYIAKMTRPLH